MNAAVYYGRQDLRLESVPEPEPGPGDVKLRVQVQRHLRQRPA